MSRENGNRNTPNAPAAHGKRSGQVPDHDDVLPHAPRRPVPTAYLRQRGALDLDGRGSRISESIDRWIQGTPHRNGPRIMSTSVIILIVGLALSSGVGIGGGIGAAGARKEAQQKCLERAKIAQMPASQAAHVCGKSRRARATVSRRAARRAAQV